MVRTKHVSNLFPWLNKGLGILAFLLLTAFALEVPCSSETQASAPAAKTSPDVPEKYRFVFLIDTSGSMMGKGDGRAVIFPKVQAEILRFLDRSPPNSEVIFVPFHQGPQDEARFRLPAEREAAKNYVKSLQATGQNTWIYRTLVYVMDKLAYEPNTATIYYILTDGMDNDKTGPYRMRDVVARFKLKQGSYDWIYYTALGTDVPKEVLEGLASLPRTRVERKGLGDVPAIGGYVLKPGTLRLGNLKERPQAQADILLEMQGQLGPLRLRVDDRVIQSYGAFITVNPQQIGEGTHTLTFELKGSQQLPDGRYAVWLCPTPPSGAVVWPQVIKVEFAHHPPASYRLVPAEAPQSLRLAKGQDTRVQYRLEGNAWAQEPVGLDIVSPAGLEVEINGQKPPVKVNPGQNVDIRIANQGLSPGIPAQPSLKVDLPPGATLADSIPPLPSVVQPKTLADRLIDLWWLWLLMLLGLLWWLRHQRPWGIVEFTPANDGANKKVLPLKGNRVSLADEIGLPGVVIERSGHRVKLSYNPLVEGEKVQVKDVDGYDISPGEDIEWNAPVELHKGGCKVGTLTLTSRSRVNGPKAR